MPIFPLWTRENAMYFPNWARGLCGAHTQKKNNIAESATEFVLHSDSLNSVAASSTKTSIVGSASLVVHIRVQTRTANTWPLPPASPNNAKVLKYAIIYAGIVRPFVRTFVRLAFSGFVPAKRSVLERTEPPRHQPLSAYKRARIYIHI